MNHNLSKQKRGRSSLNRLGVATLSSLLAVGLTPAFVNLAFAETKDAPKAKAAVTNEGKSDLTLYLKATPAEDVKGTWGSDSPIKATVAKTGENCPEWTGDVTFTKETGPFKDGNQYYKVTKDNLDFAGASSVPSGDCKYTVTPQAIENQAAGWDLTKIKDKTITVTFSKGTTGSADADKWKDQTESTGAKAVVDPADGMFNATYTGKTSVKFNPGTGAKFKESVTTTLSGEKGTPATDTDGVPTSESFEKTPEDQILVGWATTASAASATAVKFPDNKAEQEYFPVWKDAVTFDAGEGATLKSTTDGGQDAQKQTVVTDDASKQAAADLTPSAQASAKHFVAWKLTKTTTSGKEGTLYTVQSNALKEVAAGSAAYVPAKGDVLTAVWGYQVTFAAATGKTPQKTVLVQPGQKVTQTDVPDRNQCGAGSKAKFAGWNMTKPREIPSKLDAAGVAAVTIDSDKTFAPACENPTSKAKLQVEAGTFTPILDGAGHPTREALSNSGEKINLDTVCGQAKSLGTGWNKNDATGYATDLFNTDVSVDDEGTVYHGVCVEPKVRVVSDGDKVQTEQGTFAYDNGGRDYAINVGANQKYDAGSPESDDTITLPKLVRQEHANDTELVGWKLTRHGQADKTFKRDLSGLLSPTDSTDSKYTPVNGDMLTAVWGYQVTYQNDAGTVLGTELVAKPTSGNASATKKVDGKDVDVLKLCTKGIPTGDWLLAENNQKVTNQLSALASNVKVKAECTNESLVDVKFDPNGGEFVDGTENANTDTLEGKVLTRKARALREFSVPEAAALKPWVEHKFGGWAKDKNAAAPENFTTAPETDTTYYAVWQKAEPVQVKYYKDDGSLISFGEGSDAKEYVEVKYNDPNWTVINGKNEYCTSGLNFQYWVGKDTLVVAGAEPEKYSPVPLVANLDGLKAYCSAKPAAPTVDFVLGEGASFKTGEGGFVNPAPVKDGKVVEPSVDQIVAPQGKVFAGWCTEKPGEDGKCAPEKVFKNEGLEGAVKAYAYYKDSVKVTFDLKGGKLAEGEKAEALTDAKGMVQAPKFDAPQGKVFTKWCAKPETGDVDDAKCESVNLAEKTFDKAATLVAVYADLVKASVKFGSETKVVSLAKGGQLTADLLKANGVACEEGKDLKLTRDGKPFALDTLVDGDVELAATCEAKTTPGGSTGGSTGGSSSGGSYFGGGSGGSSTPSTPAKDKKPGDKKPGDKKPGAKQPVVNKFDKQFTKKVELPKSAVKRAAGADRVATSVAALSLAKNHEVVVLATGSNFPDALVGGALAGAYKAGVVLTTGATLEQSVLDSLKSYKTKTVHIVGGNGAVSLAKEAQLRAAGLQVVRHAGADRYATAQAVKAATLKALGGKSAISCNATGSNFPDALACSSAASQMGGVVDLVKPGTAVAKDATAKTVCAGGPACQAAGAGVDKVVGSDRYETAYKLAEMTPAKGSVLVSNGQSYADSLVAGALAGSLQADLVLAKPSRVNVPAGTKSAQLFGGTTVLPDSLSMYTK